MAGNDTFLGVRINATDRERFNERCEECGIENPSAFVREMIQAFNEDRLRIKRPDIPENQRKIYHDN